MDPVRLAGASLVEHDASTVPSRVGGRLVVIALAAWLGMVGTGLAALWKYADTPGSPATAPATWPNPPGLSLADGRPTLVMFAHPKCPCTRATIGELAILMAHAQGRVAAHVRFIRTGTAGDRWDDSDLRRSAAAIPGVDVANDDDGAMAAAFGADVSGQTLLYDARGKLLFSGGITFARGHSGDNPGRDALTALLTDGRSSDARTPVFGCGLHDAPSQLPEYR